MHKETVTYKGFDNVERTEDFYFHLSKADLIKMENSVHGGMVERLQKIIKSQNGPAISDAFDDLMKRSYGVRHEDGRRFIKNDEVWDEFTQTEAYSIIYTKLATDAKAASEFINNVIPEDVQLDEEALKALQQ